MAGLKAVLCAEVLAISFGLTIALDQQVHKRAERLGGVNVWGYRGTVARTKTRNELRLAMVGGTGAFGWGVAASETTIQGVRQLVALDLDRPGSLLRNITAVNLGVRGASVDRYATILRHYAGLAPDYICLYDDLQPPGRPGARLDEGGSGIFAAAGYMPALPLALEERGLALSFGSVEAGYRGQRSGVSTTSGTRAVAGLALRGAGRGLAAIDRELGRLFTPQPAADVPREASIASAIDVALTVGKGVVVIAAPCNSPLECERSRRLFELVDSRYATDARVRYVDLAGVSDLYANDLRLDGISLSVAGHMKAAEAIAPEVLSLIAQH